MMNSDYSDSLQPSSLSTLIGYITGPKAEQPVGVRVVEPPSGTRQKQRGNMYGVVDLAGDHPDHDVIADHLLTILQRTYYSAKGSQSHVMIEAVRRAHQALHEINLRHPDSALRAGVLCAALLNGRLLVVASGSAMALVRVDEQVQMFPAELPVENGPSPDAEVPIQVFRQTLGRDDVIFLGGSSWLSYVPIKMLAGVVAFTNADNCADAADELYSHGREGSPPGLLVVLVDNPDSPNPGTPTSSSQKSSKSRRSRFGGLPTALSAAPPPRTSSPPPAAEVVVATAAFKAADEVVGAGESTDQDGDSEDDGGDAEARAGPAGVEPDEVGRHTWSTRMSTVASVGVLQTRRFLTRMLPDSSGEEVEDSGIDDGPEPAMIPKIETVDEEAHPDTATAEADVPPVSTVQEAQSVPKTSVPPLPEIEPYTAPAPASGTRARIFVLIALVILIAVPAVVAAVFLGEGESRRQEAEQLTLAAEAEFNEAQVAEAAGDKVGAQEHLVNAKEYLSQAIAIDGSNPMRTAMAADIEQLLQDVLQVQRLYGLVSPLVTFPSDSRPQRVLVADSSIYVLDSGQQAVLRYRYDPSAEVVTDDAPQIVVQQGSVVDGATVGSIADMAWLPLIPGVEEKPTLLILDRNNNLFSYDPRVQGARRLELNGQQEWGGASQVQTYAGRIYLADEGSNQILRYTPGDSTQPPDTWFNPDTLVNLAGTISLEIDGDIWLLLGSGNIMRYRGGEQLPFSLENSVGLAEEPVDMYVTTEDREEVYLADAGADRILVYGKDGVYSRQLKAPEGDPLRGLSGIFIDEITETLYILTKSALYSHPLM